MSLNILVIDDFASVRLYHISLLSRKGHKCTGVASAEEGLEALAAGKIDLVLLDMVMPGMTGADFVARLSSNPRNAHVPVLIITSEESSARESLASASNPVAVLLKPVMPAALLEKVAQMASLTSPLHIEP